MHKKQNAFRCAENLRKQVLVIGGAVRLEDLGQLVASLAQVRLAHVLDKLVMILWHVQLEERSAPTCKWHPRALPRLLKGK